MGGRSTMRACVLALVAMLCVVALLPGADGAGSPYVAVDLGYPYAYSLGAVTAVNDAGELVGSGSTRSLGVSGMAWTQSTGFSFVPFADGGKVNAVSPGGRIAGQRPNFDPPAYGGHLHAFVASSAADPAPLDLGTLGGSESEAFGVNDAGTVVGVSGTSADSSETHAFVWTRAGGMVDIGTPGGTSAASAINASGVVVGTAYTATIAHAFRWTQTGGMTDLGSLGGSSAATAISDTGQVVGYSTTNTSGGPAHAFSWTQGGGMVDLGTLPGSTESLASGVDDSGLIVGNSGTRPFTWTQSGGMTALPELGGTTRARGINASGWIVGDFIDAERNVHGIIWRPTDSQPIAPSPLHLDVGSLIYGIPVTGLDVTGTRSLFIEGSGEAGATVTLYRDGIAVGIGTVDRETSQWSVRDIVAADGTYSYSATISVAGRVSVRSSAFAATIDTAGPALTVDGPPSGVYDLASIPARPTATATDPRGVTSTSDSWVPPTSASGVGDYVYTVYASDGLSNQSSATRSYTVRYGAAYSSTSTTSRPYRPGSTIPLRFQLRGGTPVTAAGATLWAHAGDTPVPVAYQPSAPAANRFHYDAASTHYAFDLHTDRAYVNSDGTRVASFRPGAYTLTIALDDGTTRIVHVRIGTATVAIGRATTTPGRPRAGTRFAITFAVTRPGTRTAVTAARMTLAVRIGTRLLRHTASYRAGTAHTSFVVPRGSRGKLVTVRLSMRFHGGVAMRVATFRIR